MFVIDWTAKAFHKVFGSRNDRLLKNYRRRVERVNVFEPDIRRLTDAELKTKTQEFREAISGGADIEEVLFEAFAVVRESMDRNIGIRNIFNPAFKDQFDTSRLPSDVRKLYEQVEKEIEQTEDAEVLGSDEPVPSWQLVDIPNRLYDAVRELYPESRRPFRCRAFDVQIIGGMVLHEGKVAEMRTGEGKTIVAPLACYVAALEDQQCHVVTVSDYHVQRDRDWVFPAMHKLGISVGAIHPMHMQPPQLKKRAYSCDIVYGTNSEFGFDYLRDNMKLSAEEQMQRRRDFCIVDEVDSILIDEARTPLIISGPAGDDAPQYQKANNVAEELVKLQAKANRETRERMKADDFVDRWARANKASDASIQKIVNEFRDLGPDFLDEKKAEQIGHTQYYVVKRDSKQAYMTHLGVEAAQKIIGTNFYVVGNDMSWDHLINNALRAHAVYEIDKEYVVEDGEVVIIDEFTGRKMVGRQWSDGLHQAVEAKEARHGVKIKKETQTLATITIQNFFKMYGRLAGMTGTAMTEATEFAEIYKLDCVEIPTNRPVIRDDADDLIFITKDAKWNAIADEVAENCEAGRPVLVGTTSVEKSQKLSEILKKRHPWCEHEVLNAKNHAREAGIVEEAGEQHEDPRKPDRKVGNVTIATNMAGRGTDIKPSPGALACGGLHVVGTERHEARRIDNQLRGRSGRQGDPGSSRFFISMEDDLMKMFAGKSTMKALSVLGMKEDDAIEHKWITRSVERAQRKVEDRNFQIRKNLLEYDEVMEYQRQTFYTTRQTVLEGEGIADLIFDYIAESIEDATAEYLADDFVAKRMSEQIRSVLGVAIDPAKLKSIDSFEDLEPKARNFAKADARQEIENTLGEYMPLDVPPEEWDAAGLSHWAMSRFSVDIKQRQVRESNPDEIAEQLSDAAFEILDRKPMAGFEKFFEDDYVGQELAEWAKRKFELDLDPSELVIQRRETRGEGQQRVAELIYDKAKAAYHEREIAYPVAFVLEVAFSAAQQGQEGTAWALQEIVRWSTQRYEMDWTVEDLKKKTADQIHEELVEEARAWWETKLPEAIDRANRSMSAKDLRGWMHERWGVELSEEELDIPTDDRRELLLQKAQGTLRRELTRLEQYVLLQILDQAWKDHLYAMDQLKDAIGLQAFAEKDPKIMYKTEGAAMFQEMLTSIRDQVTGMIYRAQLRPDAELRNAYQGQQERFDAPDGTGVTAGGVPTGNAQQQADLDAADRAGSGGEGRQVTQTIVNKTEKVGRNDPCPCGSGKKFKKCCGRSG